MGALRGPFPIWCCVQSSDMYCLEKGRSLIKLWEIVSHTYEALHTADDAWRVNNLDVSRMEEMLSNMLAAQLYFLHQKATGGN